MAVVSNVWAYRMLDSAIQGALQVETTIRQQVPPRSPNWTDGAMTAMSGGYDPPRTRMNKESAGNGETAESEINLS